MRNLIGVFLVCFSSSIFAMTAMSRGDFDVEESLLEPVPEQVSGAILRYQKGRNQELFGLKNEPCTQFVGMTQDLTGKGDEVHFVTTDGACSWGNAAAPIWVVKDSKVILGGGGWRLTVLPETHHQLPDIQLSFATIADAGLTRWVFNGKRYRKVFEDYFSVNNRKKCATYSDVCGPIPNDKSHNVPHP